MMRTYPWFLTLLAFVFLAAGSPGTAHAVSSYLTSFNSTYPSAPAAIKNCTICHPSYPSNTSRNAYANDYRTAGRSYSAIANLDSDADGFTNLVEINAGTYPGLASSRPAATVTLSSIAISGPASLNENGTATYIATATMSDNSTRVVTPTWSENSTATTISASGVLTAAAVTANQAVTVSASYTEGGLTRTASYAVTVVDVPVVVTLSSIAISGPASLNENGTATYIATATMSDNSTRVVTPTWSENSTATTISASGVLTAAAVTANQAVTVSASYTEGGLTRTASYAVTVVDVPVVVTLSSIAISGPASLNENGTATYIATATMSDNSTRVVTPTWSENSTATTISASGVLTAAAVTANQAVTVSASYTEGGLTRTASYAVTVVDVPVVADSDGDGMPNTFEQTYSFNPNDPNDAALDADGDALSNVDEFRAGTHPRNPDSDGDGVWDGADLMPNDPTRPMYNARGESVYGVWGLDSNGNRQWNKGTDTFLGSFGTPQMLPVAGDWNGDGRAKAGVYENGVWYLDSNGNGQWDGPATDRTCTFGSYGMIPVAGDWNGDGIAEIGAYENGTWYLDANGNGQWDGVGIDLQHAFGTSEMIPVVGDWNGDGRVDVGAFVRGVWYLDANGNGRWDGTGTGADRSATFGTAAMRPVAGNFDGLGGWEIAAFENGTFYIDVNGNGVYNPGVDEARSGFGTAGDLPVVGDWNGDSRAEVGVWQ